MKVQLVFKGYVAYSFVIITPHNKVKQINQIATKMGELAHIPKIRTSLSLQYHTIMIGHDYGTKHAH